MCNKVHKMMVRSCFITPLAIAMMVAMLSRVPFTLASDCSTVSALVSACSSFVQYGAPDPIPGAPCCVAMTSLKSVADTDDNRRNVCRCIMDMIMAYSSNATAIATLPGFCGVSLGFTIEPNTDCEYIDQFDELEGR